MSEHESEYEIEQYEGPRLGDLVNTAEPEPVLYERQGYEKFRTDGSLRERGVVERYG